MARSSHWGGPSGGNSDAVAEDLASGVVRVIGNTRGFAALKEDGSAVTWGQPSATASGAVAEALESGVVDIFANQNAWAALKEDGSVVTWGLDDSGGDPGAAAEALTGGVAALYSNDLAFAALKEDGSVVTWGSHWHGGDSSNVAEALSDDVVSIASTRYAFAALKADGSVVAWGSSTLGGNTQAVAEELSGGVVKIYSSGYAFAALKEDGSVVTWGSLLGPEMSDAVTEALSSGVTKIYSAFNAFAAVKEDGSVVTWGHPERGGDSSAVADQLAGGVVAIAAPYPVEPLDPTDFATPPAAPVIDTVAGDDVIDAAQAEAGITVTGTAEPDAMVTVGFGALDKQTVAADPVTGAWEVVFAFETILDAGDYDIAALATVQGLSSPLTTRPVSVVAAPDAMIIDPVAQGDVITPDDIAEGVTVTGSAPPGAVVTLTLAGVSQTATARSDGTWQAGFRSGDIPGAGEYLITAQATVEGADIPAVRRLISVIEPPAAPEIFEVAVDDVVAPENLTAGLDVRGLADPGVLVTVTFGEVSQSMVTSTQGPAPGGWEGFFDFDDLPRAGEHILSAQAARLYSSEGVIFAIESPVSERLVTIENTPAQIFGDTTGTVIEGDPFAEQFRGRLTVIDRDEGEDRFQPVGDAELETPFGDFLFNPLIGDWAFVLDNDSPAVQALEEGEEATATLSVTSYDGSASETITVTIIGDGVPADSLVRWVDGSLDDTSLTVGEIEIVFVADDGSEFTTTSTLEGTFSMQLPVGISGRLEAMREVTREEANIEPAMALDALRLAVGLQPSWGPPSPLDYVAADFNGDGSVQAGDALDILRVAVGLSTEVEPRWLFLDADADLSRIDRTNTTVETGRRIEDLTDDIGDIGLIGVQVGVLTGNPQEFV